MVHRKNVKTKKKWQKWENSSSDSSLDALFNDAYVIRGETTLCIGPGIRRDQPLSQSISQKRPAS